MLQFDFAKNACAKQIVIAIVVTKDEKYFFGSNWCKNPQSECPRGSMPTGVGYEKCKTVCNQPYHAEVDACKNAGKWARGATLYMIGHTYCCEKCKRIMRQYRIKKVIIGEMPKKLQKFLRIKPF